MGDFVESLVLVDNAPLYLLSHVDETSNAPKRLWYLFVLLTEKDIELSKALREGALFEKYHHK